MKIRLNQRELNRLKELFDTLNESAEYGSVELSQHSETEIGSVLTATFLVTHKDIEGDFTVTITDESDW